MGYHLQGKFLKRRVRYFTVSKSEFDALSKEGNSLPEGASAQDALMFVAVNAHNMPTPVSDLIGQSAPKPMRQAQFSVEKDAYGNWRVFSSTM